MLSSGDLAQRVSARLPAAHHGNDFHFTFEITSVVAMTELQTPFIAFYLVDLVSNIVLDAFQCHEDLMKCIDGIAALPGGGRKEGREGMAVS